MFFSNNPAFFKHVNIYTILALPLHSVLANVYVSITTEPVIFYLKLHRSIRTDYFSLICALCG
jgi:hypothetical protein